MSEIRQEIARLTDKMGEFCEEEFPMASHLKKTPSTAKRERWPDSMIDSVKAEIKVELDAVAEQDGEEAAVRTAMHRLAVFAEDLSDEAQLRTYTYIMSALVRFLRCGRGVSHSQVQTLTDRAYTILKLMRLRLENPRVSYLYGDLHSVLSQVQRVHGQVFRAAWEQQLAVRLYRGSNKRSKDFQCHNSAVRALRLGNADAAIELFRMAVTEAQDDQGRVMAALGLAKALRLAGEVPRAEQELSNIAKTYALDEHDLLEWQWESTLLNVQSTGELTAVLPLVRKGKSHYEGTYVAEALLLAHACQSTRYLQEIPDAKYLKRSKTIEVDSNSPLMQCLSMIEQLYDSAYPVEFRLQKLGKMLDRLSDLDAIELELMAWLAATRWLHRNRLLGLAKVALSQYQALSLRLSSGKSQDVLGLSADLLEKSWSASSADPQEAA